MHCWIDGVWIWQLSKFASVSGGAMASAEAARMGHVRSDTRAVADRHGAMNRRGLSRPIVHIVHTSPLSTTAIAIVNNVRRSGYPC